MVKIFLICLFVCEFSFSFQFTIAKKFTKSTTLSWIYDQLATLTSRSSLILNSSLYCLMSVSYIMNVIARLGVYAHTAQALTFALQCT